MITPINYRDTIANWWLSLPPLKNMSSSNWIIIPTIEENKGHVPNHQPAMLVYISSPEGTSEIIPNEFTNVLNQTQNVSLPEGT